MKLIYIYESLLSIRKCYILIEGAFKYLLNLGKTLFIEYDLLKDIFFSMLSRIVGNTTPYNIMNSCV